MRNNLKVAQFVRELSAKTGQRESVVMRMFYEEYDDILNYNINHCNMRSTKHNKELIIDTVIKYISEDIGSLEIKDITLEHIANYRQARLFFKLLKINAGGKIWIIKKDTEFTDF